MYFVLQVHGIINIYDLSFKFGMCVCTAEGDGDG